MYANITAAAKRPRGEDDCVGAFRPLTPESSPEDMVSRSLPLTKKHRTIDQYDGESAESISVSDEIMTDDNETSPYTVSCTELISSLDIDALREIVTTLATGSFDAQALVALAYGQRHRKPDLGRYAIEVDEIFRSRDQRYAVPGSAYLDIKSCIKNLAQQLGPRSAWEIKQSALNALIDIALSILRADRSRQAIEVKAQFERDDCIPQLMAQIVRSMSVTEKIRTSKEMTSHGGTFAKSLQFVHERAVEDYVPGFYDFSIVLEVLSQNTED